jgi:stage IV sporulation protein FB
MIGGAFRIEDSADFLRVGLFVLAGFLSILIHEMGHALTGRKFGATPHVILHGIGGVAIFPDARFTRQQSFLVTAAGPAIQFVLGGIAFLIYRTGYLPDTQIREFIWILFIISVFWAAINLIPVAPLDGGQMLHAILGPSKRALTLQISIFSALLGAVALYLLLHAFLFSLLLLFLAFQNFKELKTLSENQR